MRERLARLPWARIRAAGFWLWIGFAIGTAYGIELMKWQP